MSRDYDMPNTGDVGVYVEPEVGTRTPSLGKITFPLVLKYVDDMKTVSEEAIIKAGQFLFYRMKLVIEPSGALGLAALLSQAVVPKGRVGIILSGGNINFTLTISPDINVSTQRRSYTNEHLYFHRFYAGAQAWLKDNKIKQASFDGNGKFTVVFIDGAKNLYHVDDCTSVQLKEAIDLLKKHGVLFSE